MPSSSPPWSCRMRALSSGTSCTRPRRAAAAPPPSSSGSSPGVRNSPFRHSPRAKGPVPMHSSTRRSSLPSANASEMTDMLNMATSERNGAHGCASSTTTVASSGAVDALDLALGIPLQGGEGEGPVLLRDRWRRGPRSRGHPPTSSACHQRRARSGAGGRCRSGRRRRHPSSRPDLAPARCRRERPGSS